MKQRFKKITLQCVSILVSLSILFGMAPSASAMSDVNEEEYDVSRIIVRYKEGYNWEKVKFEYYVNSFNFGAKRHKKLTAKNYEVIDVGSINGMRNALKTLENIDGVEYVTPDYKLKAYEYTDEPGYGNQWGLKNTGQTMDGTAGTAGIDINFESAVGLSTGEDILVGVLDTGINITHPDLAANI